MTDRENDGTDHRRTVVLGLLADAGLPGDTARAIVADLPAVLARNITDDVRWEVRTVVEEIPLDSDGQLPLVATAHRVRQTEGWDYLVCLTELPRRSGGRTVAGDISTPHRAALVSVPAVGWGRVRRNVTLSVVRSVALLTEHGDLAANAKPGRRGRIPARNFAPLQEVASGDDGIDQHLLLPPWRGELRLLVGMVRANRPWRLVPSLSKAIAAATATAAFGLFYPSIWSMADALSPLRLLLISLFAVGTLTTWLIVHNGLWDRPIQRENPRDGVLYNLATVLTLLTGGLCMYLILFATTLAAAVAVISSTYLGEQLGHPAALSDYFTLVWLAASMGTVAGALGSSLETEEAVRQATYSTREQQRRARREEEEQEEREADTRESGAAHSAAEQRD